MILLLSNRNKEGKNDYHLDVELGGSIVRVESILEGVHYYPGYRRGYKHYDHLHFLSCMKY